MGFTKRELIQFLDGLVELASEENKVKAIFAKRWRIARRSSRSRNVIGNYNERKMHPGSYSKRGDGTARCLIVKIEFIFGKRTEKVLLLRKSDCKKHYH